MRIVVGILGAGLLAIVLVDAFTSVILARRAQRLFRITRIFYQFTWTPYAALARRMASGRHREDYLSIYGPLSLLTLFAFWAIGLILGFGLLQWAVGLQIRDVQITIGKAIYFSATVLGTLGL